MRRFKADLATHIELWIMWSRIERIVVNPPSRTHPHLPPDCANCAGFRTADGFWFSGQLTMKAISALESHNLEVTHDGFFSMIPA
jgi:hypothetical protein